MHLGSYVERREVGSIPGRGRARRGGETLIVPVRAKVGDLASIYSFNGTGSLIWKLLGSPRTVAELATAVAQAYEVEPARAEQDVTSFVSEMKAVGLVEVPPASFVAMAGD